jgi:hypothetical protein
LAGFGLVVSGPLSAVLMMPATARGVELVMVTWCMFLF